jgi:hypothetical protein
MKAYRVLKTAGGTAGVITLASLPYIADAQATDYKQSIPLNASAIPADTKLFMESGSSWTRDYPNPGFNIGADTKLTGLYGKRRGKVLGSAGFYLEDDLDIKPEWNLGAAGSIDGKTLDLSGMFIAGGRDKLIPTSVRAYGNAVLDIGSGRGKGKNCKNPLNPNGIMKLSIGAYPGMEKNTTDGSWNFDLPIEATFNYNGIMYGATYRFIEDASSELGFKIQFTNFIPRGFLEIGMTTTTDNVRGFYDERDEVAKYKFNIAYRQYFDNLFNDLFHKQKSKAAKRKILRR